MKPYPLPVSLADLLDSHKIESDRIEFKEGWNPTTVFRTVCAFANDFHNYGGGYILIGIGEADGLPVLPPAGVPDNQVDRIQRELLQYGNLIQPPYFPLLGIEERDGRKVIVLWCPGGQNRPYRVPKDVTTASKEYAYYIRHYANSVVARNGELRELMALTATVPFDDRINHHADLDDLKLPLIRSFLKEVKSDLYARAARMPLAALGRQMAIIDGPDEAPRPRNVGLIFFSEAPERFFPGTQIDVVYLPGGAGGDQLEEQIFRGPVHQQLRDALRHLQNRVIRERVTKLPRQAEAVRVFNYPFAAVEEAVVNAIYHRGYDQREPVEVRISPERIEIVSYPGPDASIRREALKGERIVARRYRNRRIGEFLKELDLTEGRSTGIPKIREAMRRNGSPPPRFDTDEERTYFLAELPSHPAFIEAGVEAGVGAGVGAEVSLSETELRVLRSLKKGPAGMREIVSALGQKTASGGLRKALDRLAELGLVSLTIPEKPNSKRQQRQLTAKGRKVFAALDTKGDDVT
jgi:ATP-dependent DNA helicase RecG